jgi:hypothetical protein
MTPLKVSYKFIHFNEYGRPIITKPKNIMCCSFGLIMSHSNTTMHILYHMFNLLPTYTLATNPKGLSITTSDPKYNT